MIKKFLQTNFNIFISVCDCIYWIAASLIFLLVPVPDLYPIVYILGMLFAMVIGREIMVIIMEYIFFCSRPDAGLIFTRFLYAFFIVCFFIISIRFLGVLIMAYCLAPIFLCLIIFPVLFYRKSPYPTAPDDRVHRKFKQFCQLYGISGINIYAAKNLTKTIFSEYFPKPAIIYSPDLNDLQEREISFLIAHETAHIKNKHFIKNRIAEVTLLILHGFLPFFVLAVVKPVFFMPGTWMPLHYAAIPLLMMTILNYPCMWLLRRYHLYLENLADIYGINITQNIDCAEKALRYLSGKTSSDADCNCIAFESSVNERIDLLRRRHPAAQAGEKEDFQSYLCLTYRCNSRCIFCASDLTGKKDFIALEDVKKFIDSDQNINSRLVLSGGEPMLHPDFWQILQYAHNKYPEICLMTNGTLLDSAEKIRELEKVITHVAIPLYGSNATSHDAITRHAGSFYKTMKCISLLSKSSIKLELKLLWSNLTIAENFQILDMIANKNIFVPDNISLTNIIIGEKAFSHSQKLVADRAEDIVQLNKLVKKMSSWNFSLQNIPLCVLEKDVRSIVLKKEKAIPPVIRLYYLAPRQKGKFISQIPEQWQMCKQCSLVQRCTRKYPGQKTYTENIHPVPLNDNDINYTKSNDECACE